MIKNINLKGFRIFDHISLNINNNLIILVGPNASGKTSILESIYFISRCKSHRTNDLNNLINNNHNFSIIELNNDNNIYKMVISKNGKKALINDNEYKKISDDIGNIKTVMFSPNNLDLIYGSKNERREFLDIELSMIDKKYLYEMKKFRKFLKERNEILKIYDDTKKVILDVITKELIESEKIIYDYRNKFINDINVYLGKIHKDLYNEKVEIKYNPNVLRDNLDNIYNNKLEYDLLTKMTNNGIHRDDILFILNDKEALSYASQGQVRSIVLSIKIAVFYYFKKIYKNDVILLLDDVFSELDNERVNNLVKFLLNDNQTFITTTSIELIPQALRNKAQIIKFLKE